MGAGFGLDELGVHPDPLVRLQHAPLQDEADAHRAADLPHVHCTALVGAGGRLRGHRAVRQGARQVGRQAVRDAVGEPVQRRAAAAACERQDEDGQMRGGRQRTCPVGDGRCRAVRGRAGQGRHGRREAVALAGDGDDPVPVRRQDPAQRRDLHLQVVFLNRQARPDPVEDRRLGHQGACAAGQHQQDVEGAAAKLDRLAVREQQALRAAQDKAAEPVVRLCRLQDCRVTVQHRAPQLWLRPGLKQRRLIRPRRASRSDVRHSAAPGFPAAVRPRVGRPHVPFAGPACMSSSRRRFKSAWREAGISRNLRRPCPARPGSARPATPSG